jgi:hypothetical protein
MYKKAMKSLYGLKKKKRYHGFKIKNLFDKGTRDSTKKTGKKDSRNIFRRYNSVDAVDSVSKTNPGKLKHAGKWTLGGGGAAVGLHAWNKHDNKRDKKQGKMNESFNYIINNTELFESIARKHLNNLNEYSAIISKINPYASIGNVKVPKNKLPKLYNEVKKPGKFKVLNKKYGIAAGLLALGMIGVRSANNGMIKKYNLKNKVERGHMDNTIFYNPKTSKTKYVRYNDNNMHNGNNINNNSSMYNMYNMRNNMRNNPRYGYRNEYNDLSNL